MARRRARLPAELVEAQIEGLSHDGRGVARVDGKVIFVDNALPGERVRLRYTTRSRQRDEGIAVAVDTAHPERVVPRCGHFLVCGGCQLQHLAPEAQLAHKEHDLLDQLEHIGGVTPDQVLPALRGPVWGYRTKARLGVKHVAKKGRVLVGFRERRSPYVADLQRCEVLDPRVGEALEALAQLIDTLEARARIPQIEVAMDAERVCLVVRHLDPLSVGDTERLADFARARGLAIALQPRGPDSVTFLEPPALELRYALAAHGVEIAFRPTDFTQVNLAINAAMVEQAMALLDPGPSDHVLDLFCGLGNFSLPLARRGALVTGVEGDAAMVRQAQANAAHNGLDRVWFHAFDLSADPGVAAWATPTRAFTKLLLDPPRSGAAELLGFIGRSSFERVVYVSCQPASLARDIGVLVNDHGFHLERAGVMDMFPHTAHVESIALLTRRPGPRSTGHVPQSSR